MSKVILLLSILIVAAMYFSPNNYLIIIESLLLLWMFLGCVILGFPFYFTIDTMEKLVMHFIPEEQKIFIQILFLICRIIWYVNYEPQNNCMIDSLLGFFADSTSGDVSRAIIKLKNLYNFLLIHDYRATKNIFVRLLIKRKQIEETSFFEFWILKKNNIYKHY